MLSSHFKRRGYPIELVQNAMSHAELQDRSVLISKNAPGARKMDKKVANSDHIFYLVNTHNPSNPQLRNIITTNWPLLGKSKVTRTLEDAKLIFGQRRNKNLFRASTKTNNHPHSKRTLCKRSLKCRYCPLIDKSGILVSTNSSA